MCGCVCVCVPMRTHTRVLVVNGYCLSKVLEGSHPVGGDLKDAETTTGEFGWKVRNKIFF